MQKCNVLCLLWLCLFFLSPTAKAWEQEPVSLVFLIDLSGSMNKNDQQREVLNSISLMIPLLPSHYQVGVIGYHSDIQIETPLLNASIGENIEKLQQTLQSAQYTSYSNAGLGLTHSVDLLREFSGEKHMIMVCDGEILLPSESATSTSEEQFQTAILEGNNADISLHVLALGDWTSNMDSSFLLSESQKMKGSLGFIQGNMETMLFSLLVDELGIVSSSPLSMTVEERMEEEPLSTITITLPFSISGNGTLILQSDRKIWDVQRESQGESTMESGDFIHLVDINQEQNAEIILSYQSDIPLTEEEIHVSVWTELSLVPTITFSLEESEKVGEITFFDKNNRSVPVLTEDFFDGAEVLVSDGISTVACTLEDGRILYPLTNTQINNLSFDFSDFPIIISTSDDIWLSLEEPILQEENEKHLVIFAVTLVCGAILGIFLQKKKTASKIPAELVENKRKSATKHGKKRKKEKPPEHFYVGKLELELTQGRDDFPVTSYSLFRVPQHRPISLEEILEVCYQLPCVEGTNQVIFSPWKDKFVALTNGSQATFLYKHEILRKNQKYHLPVGAKLDILLEDGSELVIIYELP